MRHDCLPSVFVTKYLTETNVWQKSSSLREERFILAPGVRGFSAWSFGPTCWSEHHGIESVWQKRVFTSCWTERGREREERKPAFSFLLFPLLFHLSPQPVAWCYSRSGQFSLLIFFMTEFSRYPLLIYSQNSDIVIKLLALYSCTSGKCFILFLWIILL
jgi:hypothetical protein